jgi:probable F420-dependent oxidoreductase
MHASLCAIRRRIIVFARTIVRTREVPVRFGITIFVTDRSIRPDELAREVEARGFDSLFFPEHTHIPVSRRTPAPMGEPLPEQYQRTLDLFVALSYAAGATTRLRIGSAICLVAQRDPIVTAKEVATLDSLSGGRLTFGIGFGWNVEEMADHGVDAKRRRDVVREKMLAMERLWSQDEAGFEGDLVRFESSWSWPKPVQTPRPPVLIGGGGGPKLFASIAEYADGWIPIGGRGIATHLPALQQAFSDAGRDLTSLQIMPCGTIPTPGKVEHLIASGATEIVCGAESGSRDDVLRQLDDYAKIIAPYKS